MQLPQNPVARLVMVLVIIGMVYELWPYITGFLAVVGAAQVYRVWRNRFGP